MITQIEIDGFKSFKDFKVELAPFQVIVGPNGSGKSNLFDALHLLSRLADMDLLSAFQEMRGDPNELFTIFPNGKTVDRMQMAVEIFVDRKIKDVLGEQYELKYIRLRYELGITIRHDEYGLERPYITHESLKTVPRDKDRWFEKYGLSSQINEPLPSDQADFITTQTIDLGPNVEHPDVMIALHPDPERRGMGGLFFAEKIQQTILSTITTVALPHVLAAREELRSWRFLHLSPEALRQPSSIKAPRSLSPIGGNLPTTLARMQAEDKFALTDVSRDMANLVPGIINIRVEQDKPSDKYVVYAETSDQRSFPSQVLSDGTLRLLALATLRNDPQFHGVLCLEEPDIGVDPLHLEKMAHVLREMTSDLNDPQQADEPLRQVLITTHSPLFISQPDVVDSLLLATMPTQVRGKNAPSLRITRMVPVTTPNTPSRLEAETNGEKAIEAYTIDMVRRYLDSHTLDNALDQLKKARKR